MSEAEQIAENVETIQKAAKLRGMVASPGWTDVFEPELRQGIAEQKELVATTPFDDLLALRLNQERIKFAQEILDNVYGLIADADQLLSEEAQKEALKSGAATSNDE
jgi:hypothetical protein